MAPTPTRRTTLLLLIFLAAAPAAMPQGAPPVKLAPQIVGSGFVQPVGVFSPPGDPTRLFVLEQGGAIRIIKNGVVLNTPFLDLTNIVMLGGEDGLLGMAFHPQYATNGQFFVMYNRQPDLALVVERYHVPSAAADVADPATALPFLVIAKQFGSHNGGTLAFSPIDGSLYIGVGDGGLGGDPFNNAQNKTVMLGKLLRINVDIPGAGVPYLCPPSNPYTGPNDPGLDEIFAIGIRNPWRFSIDQATGNIFISDVGQETAEEIDFVPAGWSGELNFGWRCMEGLYCSTYGGDLGCTCNDPALQYPIHTYDHPLGCAIIGGFVYRGALVPELDGHYFFSDLCKKKTWSFKYDGVVKSDFTEYTNDLWPPDGSHSPQSYGQDTNGELYIVYGSGEVAAIVRADGSIPGVGHFGAGTGGCQGVHFLTAMTPARIGMNSFYMRASNAPPRTMGLGFLGTANMPPIDALGLGFDLLIDFANCTDVILYNMPVDENGVAYAVFEIPNNPAVVGATYYAQSIFYWADQCPDKLPMGISSTDGLTFVVQG
jgi:glucose/arabinose dehydrogenase